MVYAPAGTFNMGSTGGDLNQVRALCARYGGVCETWPFENEQPQHSVRLDALWVDQSEVTNAQYQRCVSAGACETVQSCDWGTPTFGDPAKTQYPVVCVSWINANAYCRWAGARLPTESEWEYAARGPQGRDYPWGDGFDGNRLSFCDQSCPHRWRDNAVRDGYSEAAPVGAFAAGASWCGALDLAGNVWEWTLSQHKSYPYNPNDGRESVSSDVKRVLRGGSWSDDPTTVRSAARTSENHHYKTWHVGFRCVMDAH
jgi:formylglycine-generating enzyme required for sulfatase activity